MNPYDFLNLQEDASMEQVEGAYKALKAKYSEDRFLDGDAGRQGAINLMNLEEAYRAILARRESQKTHQTFGSELGEADAAIRKGDLEGAQGILNRMTERNGEWHFLQSIIYYKKGWYSDSRSQLQAAINLEPGNKKYTDALTRLDNFMSSGAQMHDPTQTRSTGGPGGGADQAMGIANCCTTLCLLDCCCNMMRCC